jgi:membrane-associated phospholipid phosphatase
VRDFLILLGLVVTLSAPANAAESGAAATRESRVETTMPALPGARIEELALGRAKIDAPLDVEPAPPDDLAARARRWAPPAALTAAALAVAFAAEPPDDPNWDTRNRFDDAVSDGLAGGSRSGRETAAITSTVLLAALGAGLGADIYALRDEYPLEQSLVVGITTSASNVLLSYGLKDLVGRERPYVRRCEANAKYSDSCDSSDDNGSFVSLHASESATLASLICVRRLRRATVTWTDRAICGGAAVTSVAAGLLRITSDEHYFTDVLAGWGIGVAFGAALPLLLPQWSGLGDPDSRTTVAPVAGPGGVGLQFSRVF